MLGREGFVGRRRLQRLWWLSGEVLGRDLGLQSIESGHAGVDAGPLIIGWRGPGSIYLFFYTFVGFELKNFNFFGSPGFCWRARREHCRVCNVDAIGLSYCNIPQSIQ